MTNSASININISATELEKFCNKLIKRSRDIAKTHDALVTLESFITLYSQTSHGSKEYQQLESVIKSITDISREKLLNKNTDDLVAALKQCNVMLLAAIHTPLSRNGFYQILRVAITRLSDDDIRLIMYWSANWVKEAKEMAEQASGFPDAMDFRAAGISIEEFQAMSDIDRVLNAQGLK